MLMHDTTVDRTTDGFGELSQFTLSELRALDAGSWHSQQFANEKNPDVFGGDRYHASEYLAECASEGRRATSGRGGNPAPPRRSFASVISCPATENPQPRPGRPYRMSRFATWTGSRRLLPTPRLPFGKARISSSCLADSRTVSARFPRFAQGGCELTGVAQTMLSG